MELQQNLMPRRIGNIPRGYVGAAILGRYFRAVRRRCALAGYEFKSAPKSALATAWRNRQPGNRFDRPFGDT
jgi:hypothetical protein